MRAVILSCLLIHFAFAIPLDKDKDESVGEGNRPYVEPEYLEGLLAEKRYEEFSRLMGIPDPRLSMPRQHDDTGDPSFHKELFQGDILLRPEEMEQVRQGLNFTKYSSRKWQTRKVPYWIAGNYTLSQKLTLFSNIVKWNIEFKNCIKFVPKLPWDNDYAFFFPGPGCYALLGKAGGQQPISLDPSGCFREGTIHHEMMHTIGFIHEQARPDRDEFIRILWDNIPVDWRPQYQKFSYDDIAILYPYDYYSIMHYPIPAPETGEPAFEILKDGIDEGKIGQRVRFTDTDKLKIRKLYDC